MASHFVKDAAYVMLIDLKTFKRDLQAELRKSKPGDQWTKAEARTLAGIKKTMTEIKSLLGGV